MQSEFECGRRPAGPALSTMALALMSLWQASIAQAAGADAPDMPVVVV
ncbi:MAG: hypothetical protein H7Z39_18275, partial [Burkholderiaceae bacterium]|nr:hypothetical protein [Burkholderiaceae bacterium]